MKKGISVLLVLSMLAGIFVTGAAAYENILDDTYTLGDVNGDGVSNALDALEVAKYLAGAEGAQIIRDAGDMNADGQVSAYDALQFRLCLAQARDWAEYESGDALYRFTIGENLVSRYSIVVPADTDPEADNVYMAAQLLQRYVKEATGAELPIVFGREEAAFGIVFHVIDENSALGKRLGVEGYIYEVTDGQLNIYGTRRGNMYAVYEIAEEYLGLLFCDSEFAYLYRQRTVDLPEGLYVERVPLLDFRYTGTRVRSNVDDYYFPRRMNGMQLGSAQYFTSRYGTLTGPHFINAHSFGYYYAMATGPADAPTLQERHDQGIMVDEYNWQPCFTSEESYEQMFTGLYLTMKMITEEWTHIVHTFAPETSAMSFSICDNNSAYCTCADCSTIYATDGYVGGSVYIANRAARDIQEYYPGMKLYMIAYDHTIPQTIFPDDNLIIMYCGTGCNNHFIGSGECGDNVTLLGGSNTYDEKALKAWGDICAQTGAELWFWYYPVTYHYYLVGCPNIFNIYEDFRYIVSEYNVTGIYYEGGGRGYNFEYLKAYLAARMIFDPDMTEEEFLDHMKEYLHVYYGDGYEELYRYIVMQNEAGDRAGCFINNYDRPRQMYDFAYIDEHYEEMRALLVRALEKAGTDAKRKRMETLIACCDFLGLSCVHHRYYKSGTEETKKLYMERYDAMYHYIKDNDMQIFSGSEYTLPSSVSYEENPMFQFYGAEREGVPEYP